MKNDIAITTVSLIRTEEESQVVHNTLNYLSRINVPLVIVDGGSSSKDKKKIKKKKNVIFFEANGLTNQLLLAHKEAKRHAKYLFYLHTDKLDFAKNTVKRMIDYYRNLEKKGLLVPVRNSKSIANYPYFQRKTEKFLNFFMSEYVGIKNDYYAGPKIYPSSLVDYFDKISGEIGWGIEAYIYILAKRLGIKFDFIPLYMNAPKDVDNEEETKLYRLKIAKWQIEGLMQAKSLKLLE